MARCPATRWPRVGCPFLPLRLREAWADEVLPAEATPDSRLTASTTYADLGDAVWERADAAGFRPLADHLRELVRRRIANQPANPLANAPVLVRPWPLGVEPAQAPFWLRPATSWRGLQGSTTPSG